MTIAWHPGQLVVGTYKTGEYIGEIVELSSVKAAVKVLAVFKHPAQGDLHLYQQGNVSFFHQRRALAFQEICLIPLNTLAEFQNPIIPDYQQSLQTALQNEIEEQRETLRAAGLRDSHPAMQGNGARDTEQGNSTSVELENRHHYALKSLEELYHLQKQYFPETDHKI